jgi:threonine dehydratase
MTTISYDKLLRKCHRMIAPYIHRTPVLTSKMLNHISGASLYFKCENFQRMGAFKMRGAVHAILQLSEEQKKKGVITHSSGNFAQALSLAAKTLGIKATIVMPENAPGVKKDAVKGYGGNIVECESTAIARELLADKLVKETGATFIHPSNDLNVIIGQGTAAMELLEEIEGIENIVTPVGGGGLIAGTALAANYFGKNVSVFGGEPDAMDDAYRSLKSGKIETNTQGATTIADGLRTNLGDINFPIIKEYVKEIIPVSENEIKEALQLIWERVKIIVEPSSAVALAAVLKRKDLFRNSRTGIIMSGGNVELKAISAIFR